MFKWEIPLDLHDYGGLLSAQSPVSSPGAAMAFLSIGQREASSWIEFLLSILFPLEFFIFFIPDGPRFHISEYQIIQYNLETDLL